MNWIKENKFLAGFLGVVIILAGGLGYLIYVGLGNYTQTGDDYNTQSRELQRLEALVPYPDEANLKKQRDLKDAYVADVVNLEKELAAVQFPLVPARPEEFQDILKTKVDAIIQRAAQTGVKIPDKFYLGFDVYQATPPKGDAAAPLVRELKAIDLVVNTLLNDKVDAVLDVKRPSISEEATAKGGGNQSSQSKLVSKTPFEVTFIADQNRFRRILNDISSSQKQFFIVRDLTIKNEKEEGPKRGDELAAAPGTDNQGGQAPRLQFIVGTEKLMVTAKIEMVDFTTPATK